MSEVTPEDILSRPETLSGSPTAPTRNSTWGTIFWLIVFTPVGWYWVWKKTTWPRGVKVGVILLTLLLVLGLLIETELISAQISGQLTNVGV